MDFQEVMLEYQIEKDMADRVTMLYLEDIDLDVCRYVTSQLTNIDIGNINYGKEISFQDVVFGSLDEMLIFRDEELFRKLFKLVDTTAIHMGTKVDNQFSAGVYYDLNKDGSVDIHSGRITRFSLPKTLNELSIYNFGHELIHALKETNYMEYVYAKSLGEVIPIFFEFMIYNPEQVLKKEFIKFRMSSLMSNKLDYVEIDNVYRRNWMMAVVFNDDEIYKRASLYDYIRSKIGCYLNSFYYAFILYKMYKENPDKILCLVLKVLNHEMTTLDMLNDLGIYGNIQGEVFEKELGKIRKLVG